VSPFYDSPSSLCLLRKTGSRGDDLARILVNFGETPPEGHNPIGNRIGKKVLDRERKRVYVPRFIFENFTLRWCNGFLLNPVIKKMFEAEKKQKSALLFSQKTYIYTIPIRLVDKGS
jgi:hypothetical protein